MDVGPSQVWRPGVEVSAGRRPQSEGSLLRPLSQTQGCWQRPRCYLALLCLHDPVVFSCPHGAVIRTPVLLDQPPPHYDLIFTNDTCGDLFPNEGLGSGLSTGASGGPRSA